MDWKLVKDKIKREIESIINTIDPSFDIENSLNIYLDIFVKNTKYFNSNQFNVRKNRSLTFLGLWVSLKELKMYFL